MATEYYIGGDDAEHFNLWNKLYPDQEVPEYSSTCTDCQDVISTNIFLEDDQGRRRIVGECCYSKYPQKTPMVQNISQVPSNSSQVHSNSSQKDVGVEQFDVTTHFDDGKYKGFSFETVFQNDPGYMEYLSTKPSEVGTAIHNASLYFLAHKDQVKPFFHFGKYRGMTFERVKEINPGYFSFLQKNEGSNDRYAEALKWYQSIPQEPTVPLGKWRGATYTEVAGKDVDYMKWVIRSVSEATSPLYPFCQWIRKTYPNLSTSPAPKAPSSDTIGYGKHSGKTLNQIWEEDPDYFIYLAQKSPLKGNHAAFNRQAINFYVEKKGYEIKDSLTIDTGKYQGKTVVELANEQPDYFDWLQDGCRSRNESLLKAAIWWRLNRMTVQ